jgi:hypothetical protein
LNGSTVANSLIWVNTSVWLFSIEKLFDKLSDFWDSC